MTNKKEIFKVIAVFVGIVLLAAIAVGVLFNVFNNKEEKAEKETVTIHFYNADGWDEVYAYNWSEYGYAAADWPGEKMTPTPGGVWYEYEANADLNKIVFNNGLEGNAQRQTDDLKIGKKLYYYNGWYSTYQDAIEANQDD